MTVDKILKQAPEKYPKLPCSLKNIWKIFSPTGFQNIVCFTILKKVSMFYRV